MSIYPITESRLPVFSICGHSNGDGWAGTQYLFSPNPHLAPHCGVSSALTDPAGAWYKNVYVFTSDHPWPGELGTPTATSIGSGEWLEMCVGVPDSPAVPWPHPSPFVYPNNAGACYPHWGYKAYDSAALDGNRGVRFGIEIPFQWLWRNHFNSQVGMVKLAFGASYLYPQDTGVSTYIFLNPYLWSPSSAEFLRGTVDVTQYDSLSWWTPLDAFDWAPSTDCFFGRWLDKMAGAQAALPSGSKMDVRLLINWLGDNDAGKPLEAVANFKEFVKTFVSKQRQACVDNDWTTLPAKQIPVCWMGIYSGYGTEETRSFMNDVLQEIEDDDPYFRWIDTDGYDVMVELGETSFTETLGHFGSTGYISAAQDVYDAFVEMSTEPWDAIAEEDRVTVDDVKDRVLTYYNRSRVQTDISDDTLLIHMNGALNRILNDVGDNAYWLRKRESMALEVGLNNITTMPKYVARVLKIENPSDITEGLQFQLIGHADGGKVQIHLLESGTGTYTVHYITRPRDLTLDTELVPIPRQIMEWLVVETARRLARGGTNVALLGSLEGEARDLRDKCIKDLQVTQRAKRDKFQTVRRWPTLRYGTRARRWGNN